MTDKLTQAATWYIVFILSTALHEASHAWAAFRLGDRTAYHAGQLTLNPLPHIRREFFGMVIVPLVSFFAGGWMIGWASCPYDPLWAQRYPKRSAKMALAGPAANLLLVLLAGVLIRIGLNRGVFEAPNTITASSITSATNPDSVFYGLSFLLSILFMLNLVLFCFNLIPLPPLDGSSLPLLVLDNDASDRYQQVLSQPGVSLLGRLIAWQGFGTVFQPIQLAVINLLYPGISYG